MIPRSSYSTSWLWEEAARTSILSVGKPLGRWHCCVYCMSRLIWENQLVHSSISHLLKETFGTMWEFMHWLNMPARLILCLRLSFKCFLLGSANLFQQKYKTKTKKYLVFFDVHCLSESHHHPPGRLNQNPWCYPWSLPEFIIKSPQRSLSFLHLSESEKSASLVWVSTTFPWIQQPLPNWFHFDPHLPLICF